MTLIHTRRQLLKGLATLSLGAFAAGTGLWPGRLGAAVRTPAIGRWGFDIAGMDKSTPPGDDFFRYAGGTWLDKTQIPADRARWGAFDVLRAKSESDVREAIEAVAAGTRPEGSVAAKVVDYYESYIDTTTIEKLGMAPAAPDLERIAQARSYEDIVALVNAPELRANLPINVHVTLDAKRPDKYVMGVAQWGLGMPDRDYYLSDDARFASSREKYRAFVESMLGLAGYADPAKNARLIYDVEHRIAEIHWPKAKSRNRDLTYNPKTMKQLEAFAPEFPWRAASRSFGAPAEDFFVVAQTDAVQSLAKLFSSTPLATWRAYLTFHYLNEMCDVLPRQLDEANFDFYGRVITGQLEQRDRWKRAVNIMGFTPIRDAVGQLYVKNHFSPAAKAEALRLVDNLRQAYRQRIAQLPWMSATTKKAALEKLDKMAVKIGYPDKWRDYTSLEIKADDAYGNRKREFAFGRRRDIERLSGPADRSDWAMSPQTVNAYHRPVWNEIVFPAAILQAPFFDPAADDAVNYGGIGAVIGHEMGHAFDDQGAKTDANGILRNWWSAADKQRFAALTAELAGQYSKFEALPGLFVNGKLTLGEDIGDLGGLNVALEAYKLSGGAANAGLLDGFSGLQRFFLGFSQIWRSKIREEALRNQVVSDPHAPGRFRTNGTVRNMDEWYAAFDVAAGNKLYLVPSRRVRIW